MMCLATPASRWVSRSVLQALASVAAAITVVVCLVIFNRKRRLATRVKAGQQMQPSSVEIAEPTVTEEWRSIAAEETQTTTLGLNATRPLAPEKAELTLPQEARPWAAEEVQETRTEETPSLAEGRRRKPEERGGRPRGPAQGREEGQTQKTAPRRLKPEIVCRKSERQWVLAVEVPEELIRNSSLTVLQNAAPLRHNESEEAYWDLEGVSGEIVVHWNEAETIGEAKVELGQEGYLLFKLSGQDLNQGRLVRFPSSGSYLVIVPDGWERDETISGLAPVMPEPASLDGYKAHFFDLAKGSVEKIAFRVPNGKPVIIERKALRFELIGTQLPDAAERIGPLFGDSPPRVGASDEQAWDEVKTIVVGEEGRGRRRWRTEFWPRPGQREQDLPPEVAARKSGWYFLRFYDAYDDLIDSLDFRFIGGLREIKLPETPPLPSESGHRTICVEFVHTPECVVEPRGNLTGIQIERKDGGTNLTIPPDPSCDRSHWRVSSRGGRPVEVVIQVERIWWALGEENNTPSQWTDKPFELTRGDFPATSNRAVWLRLPHPGWVDSVLAGFEKHKTRKFSVKVSETVIKIPLRDFGDAQELSRIGVTAFNVWVTSYRAKVADITVKAACRFCDFSSFTEGEVFSHIESDHLDYIFPPLTWQELRQHDPRLPHRIYKCSYCDFYVASDDPQNPTSAIIAHIEKECPKVPRGKGPPRILFRTVQDVDEIRERVIKALPRIYKCCYCSFKLEDATSQTKTQHLIQRHKQQLVKPG